MAGKHKLFQNPKSITGLALIGLGALILAGNLVSAAVHLSHLVGISADLAEMLGPLNIAGIAASQALWAYLFNHQEFSRDVQRILISFWPVVLVIAGGIVWRNGFAGEAGDPQKKMPGMSISPLLVRR
jgi:hypothetical protein